MNARAVQLVAQQRRVMAMLPGAMSLAIFEGRTWTLINVIAATDDSVYTLSLLLGLNAPKERRVATGEGPVRWLHSTAERTERGRGLVTIDITGPRHPTQSDSE